MLNVADSSVSKSALPGAQDAARQCIGSVMGNGAGVTEHDRLERTKYMATVRSEGYRPSMTPVAVAATAAPTMSAPPVWTATTAGAVGAAAAARREAKQEQHTIRLQPVISAASAAAGLSAPSHGTHTDDTTGSPICPDSSCSTPPTPPTAVGTGGRGRSGSVGQLSTVVVGEEESGKGEAGATVRGGLQRQASGPAGGSERRGACVRRVASFTVSPPRPERSSVGNVKRGAADVVDRDSSGAVDTAVDPGTGDLETMEALEAMAPIPEEERDSVDGLLKEVRFPLISTSFLCQGILHGLQLLGVVCFGFRSARFPPWINHIEICVCS